MVVSGSGGEVLLRMFIDWDITESGRNPEVALEAYEQ